MVNSNTVLSLKSTLKLMVRVSSYESFLQNTARNGPCKLQVVTLNEIFEIGAI